MSNMFAGFAYVTVVGCAILNWNLLCDAFEHARKYSTDRTSLFFVIPVVFYVGCQIFRSKISSKTLYAMMTLVVAIIFLQSSQPLSFLKIVLYLAGLYLVALRMLDFFGFAQAEHRALSAVVLAIALSYFATLLFLVFEIDLALFVFGLMGIGGVQAARYLWSVLRGRELPSTLDKVSQSQILVASLALAVALVGVALTFQPLIEWDSLMGHVPTVRHFVESGSLAPNKFNIQTYMAGVHHINGVSFYLLAGEFGLKILNLLMAAVSVLALLKLIQALLENDEHADALLAGLVIVSSPLFLTTAGTFQYDMPLVCFMASATYYLVVFVRTSVRPSKESEALLFLCLAMGVMTKLSFVLSLPAFAVVIVYQAIKSRRLPWLGIGLTIALASIFLARNAFQSHGDPLYPYNELAKITEADWASYGFGIPKFLRGLTVIPGAVLVSSKFGPIRDFTLGLGILIGYLLFFSRGFKPRLKLVSLVFWLSLFLLSFTTEFIRYYLYLLALTSVFIAADLFCTTSRAQLRLKRGVLAAVVILNLATLPAMGWWVQLRGSYLSRSYSIDRATDQRLGGAWVELNLISEQVSSGKAILVSDQLNSLYYWANSLKRRSVVPLVWQSSLGNLNAKDGIDFQKLASELGFTHLIIPNDELEVRKRLSAGLSVSQRSASFTVFHF